MKKSRYYLILYCIIFILSGCNRNINKEETSINSRTQNENIDNFDWLPTVKNENEILLYDKFGQRILTYNTETNEIVMKNDAINYLQFEFNNLSSNIYTTGHSIENRYKIIQKEEKEIIVLYQMGENEAIFPLAYNDNEHMYFLKAIYSDTGEEIYQDRVVCRFNAKTKILTELKSTKGMRVSAGTLIDDILYLTVYNVEKDRYELYQTDSFNGEKLKKISHELIAEDIYNNNGMLWVSDNKNIYDYNNREVSFPKKILNYFFNNYLFQIGIDVNGDSQLTVTNINTREVENTIDNIIDVRILDDQVYIYTSEKIIVI